MFFLALSPIQVALLSQYPRLPLHSNMLLITCPFYPLWICTHCRPYLKQSKHRIIRGKKEQKPACQPWSLYIFIFHTEIWKISFTHWTVATILACVGHASLHTFLTRHKQQMVLEEMHVETLKLGIAKHWLENRGHCVQRQPCSLCTLSQHKQQRLCASECQTEHRAIITFRFLRLRSLCEILLKGNPFEFRILWCLPILFTTSLPWEM